MSSSFKKRQLVLEAVLANVAKSESTTLERLCPLTKLDLQEIEDDGKRYAAWEKVRTEYAVKVRPVLKNLSHLKYNRALEVFWSLVEDGALIGLHFLADDKTPVEDELSRKENPEQRNTIVYAAVPTWEKSGLNAELLAALMKRNLIKISQREEWFGNAPADREDFAVGLFEKAMGVGVVPATKRRLLVEAGVDFAHNSELADNWDVYNGPAAGSDGLKVSFFHGVGLHTIVVDRSFRLGSPGKGVSLLISRQIGQITDRGPKVNHRVFRAHREFLGGTIKAFGASKFACILNTDWYTARMYVGLMQQHGNIPGHAVLKVDPREGRVIVKVFLPHSVTKTAPLSPEELQRCLDQARWRKNLAPELPEEDHVVWPDLPKDSAAPLMWKDHKSVEFSEKLPFVIQTGKWRAVIHA